jgi:transposase
MKEITTVGIDLAKTLFTVHRVDAAGRIVLRKTVWREKVMDLIAALPPCLIGMEACGGAHEWARRFEARGHLVGIMMARFVAPYRKSSKNDGNDAEAICEAVARPRRVRGPTQRFDEVDLTPLISARVTLVDRSQHATRRESV